MLPVGLVGMFFFGATILVVALAAMLAARTALYAVQFIAMKRAGSPNSEWTAILGIAWLLMTILFLKFVVVYHFTYIRTLGS